MLQQTDFAERPLAVRVREGVAWSAASLAITHLTGLARSIVLARLLAPEDFGLFGMALTVLIAAGALSQIGLDMSVIVNRFSDDEEFSSHLNTVWTTELVRRCLLTLLLVALVYPTTKFYGDERLFAISLFISLTPLVQGFQNIGLLILRKQVSLKRIVWFEQTINVLSTLLAIGLAYWTRSVWALVLTQILSALLSVFLSYAFHSYRPRFEFDREAFRRAFEFGKFVFVISVAGYVTTMVDNVLVGRLLGAAALGIYVLAYNLASLPIGIISGVLGSVSLSAYSELATRELHLLEGAFERLVTLSAAILIVMVVPVVILADELISVLYGAKWAAAAPVLRILMFVAFCRGLLQVVAPLLMSVKGPRPEATAKTWEAIIFVILLYPMTVNYGLTGAAWVGSFVYVITLINRFRLLREFTPAAALRLPRIIWSTLFAGAIGVGSGALVLMFLEGVIVRLAVGGLVSTSVTALVLLLLLPALRSELIYTFIAYPRVATLESSSNPL
jgi:O-antigen/teichoic acid export membrane protein